jgi:hypothetical protein
MFDQVTHPICRDKYVNRKKLIEAINAASAREKPIRRSFHRGGPRDGAAWFSISLKKLKGNCKNRF